MSEAIQRLRQLADQHDPERQGLGAELHRAADQLEAERGGGSALLAAGQVQPFEGAVMLDLLGFRDHRGHEGYAPAAGIRWISTSDDGEHGVLYLEDDEVETQHSARELARRFAALTGARVLDPDVQVHEVGASPDAAGASSESVEAGSAGDAASDSDSGRTMTDDLPGVMGGPGTYAGQPEPEEPTGGETGGEAGGELPGGFPGR